MPKLILGISLGLHISFAAVISFGLRQHNTPEFVINFMFFVMVSLFLIGVGLGASFFGGRKP